LVVAESAEGYGNGHHYQPNQAKTTASTSSNRFGLLYGNDEDEEGDQEGEHEGEPKNFVTSSVVLIPVRHESLFVLQPPGACHLKTR